MSDNDIIDVDNPISDKEEIEEIGTEEKQIPDWMKKYQGKSQEEIIEMHRNAERELSRLGNEVGENRKLIDKLLQTEHFKPTPSQEPEPDWDFEPDKAAEKLVKSEVGSVKSKVDALERSIVLRDFESKHGKLSDISQQMGQDFYDWVNKSKLRSKMFMSGMYNKTPDTIDLDVVDELLTEWNEIQPKADPVKREKDLKAASLERGGSTSNSRKKTWSRAYIRHLRLNEPAKYKANYDDIMAAYDEGRVTK